MCANFEPQSPQRPQRGLERGQNLANVLIKRNGHFPLAYLMRQIVFRDFICHLMSAAIAHLRSEGIKPPKLTLMAIGGYGRQSSFGRHSGQRDNEQKKAKRLAKIARTRLAVDL